MPEDVVVAEPSTAEGTEQSPAKIDLTAMTREERQTWREKGTFPKDQPKVQEPAPVDPPKEAKSEAKAETAAEAEPASPQEKEEPKRKPDAERRIAQLTAKVKELEERNRERESAAQPAPKTEEKAEKPKRPNPFKWTGTPEEFEQAQDAYEKELRTAAAQQALQEQAKAEQAKEIKGKLDEARQRYADADERILPAAQQVFAQDVPFAIRDLLDGSEVLPDLLYTLNADGKLGEFIQKAKANPAQAVREIVLLEHLVKEELAKPKKAEEKVEEDKPVVPVTRAPKPVTVVGGQGTQPEDALASAAQAGTRPGSTSILSREFKDEANRRYAARNR